MQNNNPKRLPGAAFACLILASLVSPLQAAEDEDGEARAKFRASSTAKTMLMAPMRDGV